MDNNIKKALLIFGGGVLVFMAFKYIKPNKSKKTTSTKANVNVDKKNAQTVLTAYIDANNNGESKQFLNDMNTEFAKTYKMRVYVDKDGGAFVTDLKGDRIDV
jgi:hypothetical protein